MDWSCQLVGQDGVDPALTCHPALPRKAGRDDFEPEMSFLATLGAGVMAGMQVGIIVDDKPRGLERGFELLADLIGDGHEWAAFVPKWPFCQRFPDISPGNLSPSIPDPILF